MHCDRCGRETSDVGILPGPEGPAAVCIECQHPQDDPTLANLRAMNERLIGLTGQQETRHLGAMEHVNAMEAAVRTLAHETDLLREAVIDRPSWLFWAGIVTGILGTVLFRACAA